MGKKPMKKSKNGRNARNATAAEPLAVLYHLDAGTSRGDAVRTVLSELGIRVRSASENDLGQPVGALAGLPGFKRTAKPFAGKVPHGEFMLLAHVDAKLMNTLLPAMRAADASVGCKAQVTQHNRLWPFGMLIAEVSAEHELMTKEPDANTANA